MQDLFIDGQWQSATSSYDVHSPWDGRLVGSVASAGREQAEAAVNAAEAAEPMAAHARSRVLARVADAIEQRPDRFADTITAESGKPISAARAEVLRAVDTFRLSAAEALGIVGESIGMDAVAAGEGMLGMTVPEAVGVVAAITPFNFPLNLVAHKVGPAIAAGCPVLLKPSEKTPLTAGLLTQAFADAGLPAGWLNLVTGDPEVVTGVWLQDPRVALVTFTGSTRIGHGLRAHSPDKRHVLELGSNTGMVVADSADVDAAVRAAVASSFTNSGQACISLQRVYVTPGVVDAFTERLSEATGQLFAGDPGDDRTVVGPLITPDATARVRSWIDQAMDTGAKLHTGGVLDDTVLRPTVLSNVPAESPLICEEVFGPVVSVTAVETLGDAVRQLNASRFGLNTAVFTRDVGEAMAFAKAAQAGTVLVNAPPGFRADHMPYGGVKQSGEGREGVPYAVRSMLESKLVVFGASPAL